jgi:hypothetical protein
MGCGTSSRLKEPMLRVPKNQGKAPNMQNNNLNKAPTIEKPAAVSDCEFHLEGERGEVNFCTVRYNCNYGVAEKKILITMDGNRYTMSSLKWTKIRMILFLSLFIIY